MKSCETCLFSKLSMSENGVPQFSCKLSDYRRKECLNSGRCLWEGLHGEGDDFRIAELERKVEILKKMVVCMCNTGLIGNGLVSYKQMKELLDEFKSVGADGKE